jgi:hypothetical protein
LFPVSNGVESLPDEAAKDRAGIDDDSRDHDDAAAGVTGID